MSVGASLAFGGGFAARLAAPARREEVAVLRGLAVFVELVMLPMWARAMVSAVAIGATS
jgi:hypothetical protein